MSTVAKGSAEDMGPEVSQDLNPVPFTLKTARNLAPASDDAPLTIL